MDDAGETDDAPPPSKAVLVVPIPDAARVANLCVALGVDADVVPAGGAGAAVVLGPETDGSVVAQGLSRALGQADVLLLRRLQGRVEVERWRANVLHDAPPPGLVLSAMPEQVERLLLTDIPGDRIEGAVSTARVGRGGRVGALWRLVRGARRPT